MSNLQGFKIFVSAIEMCQDKQIPNKRSNSIACIGDSGKTAGFLNWITKCWRKQIDDFFLRLEGGPMHWTNPTGKSIVIGNCRTNHTPDLTHVHCSARFRSMWTRSEDAKYKWNVQALWYDCNVYQGRYPRVGTPGLVPGVFWFKFYQKTLWSFKPNLC